MPEQVLRIIMVAWRPIVSDFWKAAHLLTKNGFKIVGLTVNPRWRNEYFPKLPSIPKEIADRFAAIADAADLERLQQIRFAESDDVKTFRFEVEPSEPQRFQKSAIDPNRFKKN